MRKKVVRGVVRMMSKKTNLVVSYYENNIRSCRCKPEGGERRGHLQHCL
jgi:hypothetical protein